MIGTDGDEESWEYVLLTRLDNDNDDYMIMIMMMMMIVFLISVVDFVETIRKHYFWSILV